MGQYANMPIGIGYQQRLLLLLFFSRFFFNRHDLPIVTGYLQNNGLSFRADVTHGHVPIHCAYTCRDK